MNATGTPATPDATRDGSGWFVRQVHGGEPKEPPGGFDLLPPGFAEALMESLRLAIIPQQFRDSEPLPPPTWRQRFRRKCDAWREQLACWAFRRIAGYDVPNGDYW